MTWAVKEPAVLEETVRVAVPNGPVLVGLIVEVSPLEEETARNTVLLNPLTPCRLMEEVPDAPGVMVMLAGLGVIVKSGTLEVTVTITVVECDRGPLIPVTIAVPVTVIVYEPAGVEGVDIVNVEVPVPPERRMTLVGLKPRVRPAGETESVRLTLPVNPPRLVNVID